MPPDILPRRVTVPMTVMFVVIGLLVVVMLTAGFHTSRL